MPSPRPGLTTGQMLEQWVELRRIEWEKKSLGPPDENLRRIRNHLIPHIGDVPLRKLRPIDITMLYAKLRAGGQAEGSVRRIHNIGPDPRRRAVHPDRRRWQHAGVVPVHRRAHRLTPRPDVRRLVDPRRPREGHDPVDAGAGGREGRRGREVDEGRQRVAGRLAPAWASVS
jgi:hypothetical protein